MSETSHGHRLKKPEKSTLAREVISRLPKESQNVKCEAEMVVFDFMSFIRKLPFKKLNLKTYGELAAALIDRITSSAADSSRIDI